MVIERDASILMAGSGSREFGTSSNARKVEAEEHGGVGGVGFVMFGWRSSGERDRPETSRGNRSAQGERLGGERRMSDDLA